MSIRARATPGLLLVTMIVAVCAVPVQGSDHAEEIERIGARLGMDGELAVRIIAMGLNNPRSTKPEDADALVCFFDKPIGSRITHLLCATNRVLGKGAGRDVFALGNPGGSSQTIGDMSADRYNISMPQNPRRIREVLASLGGLPEMNARLVQMGLHGVQIPRDLPTQAELDQFVEAHASVADLQARWDPEISRARGEERDDLQAQSDHAQEGAIRDAGLTLDRYNRIAEHVSEHPELFDYVRASLQGA